jgi:small ligand-binding sensory domain FIST
MAERTKLKLENRKPIAVLHFDCAARGKLCFGNEAKEKGIDVLKDVIGKDIPWLGLYSYGEIGPIAGKNYFHNFTASLCIIY